MSQNRGQGCANPIKSCIVMGLAFILIFTVFPNPSLAESSKPKVNVVIDLRDPEKHDVYTTLYNDDFIRHRYGTAFFDDIDGDGLADLIAYDYAGNGPPGTNRTGCGHIAISFGRNHNFKEYRSKLISDIADLIIYGAEKDDDISCFTADVNSDGLHDLVIWSPGGYYEIILSTTMRNLKGIIDLKDFIPDIRFVHYPWIYDLNNDGFKDLVLYVSDSFNSRNWSVILGKPDLQIGNEFINKTPDCIISLSENRWWSLIDFLDYNGDCFDDLLLLSHHYQDGIHSPLEIKIEVIYGPEWGTTRYVNLDNQPNMTLIGTIPYVSDPYNGYPYTMDINLDGKDDIYFFAHDGKRWCWYYFFGRNMTGTYEINKYYDLKLYSSEWAYPYYMKVSDLNMDGNYDLILSDIDFDNNTVNVYLCLDFSRYLNKRDIDLSKLGYVAVVIHDRKNDTYYRNDRGEWELNKGEWIEVSSLYDVDNDGYKDIILDASGLDINTTAIDNGGYIIIYFDKIKEYLPQKGGLHIDEWAVAMMVLAIAILIAIVVWVKKIKS